ncbi:tyrosine phosphatase family-domain-containing protein [Durotheca rogersii]|uniref:tyrosine phosphatase family-domain-containing protein n=1 Tax=Durotheca rogersii TaxID=419775 RepID=UPI00221E65E2|nr:tyrosine phosphatase family-domain-containing protein [Durotheca rogersii]KAI5860452.1 tyrosine phosphatase family-domain-containing protein [Durotheca rogersii]
MADNNKKELSQPPHPVPSIQTGSLDVVFQKSYFSARDITGERRLQLSGTPPVNFANVLPGLYRSGYPQASDYPFLANLHLKTIVTLVGRDSLPNGFSQFMADNHINHKVFDMAGTKKADIPLNTMQAILSVISNRQNYPLLVHCNHGRHRTGCVIGVLRKTQDWDLPSIIQEYTKFAEPKARETDVEYIADFKTTTIQSPTVRQQRAPNALRTFYGMVVVVSLTLSVWVYSSARILMITVA